MNPWFDLAKDRQQVLCEEAQARSGIGRVSVEKDFWVCWALRELFGLADWGPQFTFKGGTSLSKAWKLIDRFSEDLDVVIEREFLGFGGPTLSRKQLEKLRKACGDRIARDLLPAFRNRVTASMRAGDQWSIDLAPEDVDADRQTLLFRYPTVFPGASSYVVQIVKIEFGARSETEPAERPMIGPMLAEIAPDVLGPSTFAVHTVAARRTFWEKAMLLHEEDMKSRPPKAGLSRHYYDLWCLIRKGIANQAVADSGLFDRVARHREVFFRQSRMDYSTLRKGSLKIAPRPELEGDWRRDYAAMRERFFTDLRSSTRFWRVFVGLRRASTADEPCRDALRPSSFVRAPGLRGHARRHVRGNGADG